MDYQGTIIFANLQLGLSMALTKLVHYEYGRISNRDSQLSHNMILPSLVLFKYKNKNENREKSI